MPLTPGGKVDLRALPAPVGSRTRPLTPYAAPRTPLEEELAAMWAEVLGTERVGINDNFFHLRGHSLLAAQLISRVRERFEVELPLREIFAEPTVAGMATAVTRCRAEQVEKEDAAQLADLLAELDQLSDEEAKRLLTGEAQ